MTDLQQFCSTDPERPYLHKPFSHGEWTYATNGHIAVRVARLANVPDGHVGNQLAAIFSASVAVRMWDVPMVEIPERKASHIECDECKDNTWNYLDRIQCAYPDCVCRTEDCSVSIGREIVAGHYLRMIQQLPNAQIGPDDVTAGLGSPIPFSFDGGEGLLMPRSTKEATHIVVDWPPRLSPTPHAEAAP